MRNRIFLITLLIASVSFAQESGNNTRAEDFKRFQIGVNFSPDYCYRTLGNNDVSLRSADIINLRNLYEVGKLGYTSGLNVAFNLSDNIGIEAGVQYSNKGYQTEAQKFSFGSNIDPRNGFVYKPYSGPTSTMWKVIYNNCYLDIPVKMNYVFGKKKVRLTTSAGILTNIFLKETITSIIEYDNGTRDKKNSNPTSYNNKINISPLLSVGLDWKLNNRSNLRIEPTLRYGVLKISDTPVTSYLWNAGLNISYYIGLK